MGSISTPMEQDSCRTCGICGKQITDQGVLDCCQHLFCFSCIDDWASVTNLCPICKLRFRLITCLPGRSAEPGSGQECSTDRKRDDDQLCPSFYIDEEAVTCLEGDECLVRSGKAMEVEADDTSVACDCCDRWYHAGCVGFDTLGCTQKSWWCPRCALGTEANLGPLSASQKPSKSESAANNLCGPAVEMHRPESASQGEIPLSSAACSQQKNSQNTASSATTSKVQSPRPDFQRIRTRLPESFSVTTRVTSQETNPKKRSRTAVEVPDHQENVDTRLQGLFAGVSPRGVQRFTNTDSQQEKAKSPQTGGHEDVDDLVEIVRDPGYRVAQVEGGDGYNSPRSAGETAIRTRIIMHRAESGESSVVEQVRQQMRSAAGYGAAEDLGKVDLSDDRFLAAYKAAVAAKDKGNMQATRAVRKGSSWVMKALTHGTSVRDKLTRKLYGGTSTRRTWDRDWDVAFWKGGRGISRKRSEHKVHVESPSEQSDSAAEKVYLADISLFARKDDTESISAPESDCQFVADVGHISLSNKVLGKGPLVDSRGNGQQLSHQHTRPDSKSKSLKDMEGALSVTPVAKLDVNDKRKWALEVLARKKGELGPAHTSKAGKRESLVDFLPLDLRPSIDISLSSKIPSATRQTQLNRILEHQLRSSGVRQNPRSVKCQQAIAAAVGMEHEIFEKSNTKGVYLNLCARATSRSTCKGKGKESIELPSSSTDRKVREALIATGLLSDSDSDSPRRDLSGSSVLAGETKEDNPPHSGYGGSPSTLVSAQSDAVISQELTGNSPATAGVSLDLNGQQPTLGAEMFCSSPLYLDEDFGLDGEDLEAPMVIGHTANTAHKDGTSKVKVVLTTFNKFKHAGSIVAEAESEKPEKVVEDIALVEALGSAPENAEQACRDTSGEPTTEEAGEVRSQCLTMDLNQLEAVTKPLETTEHCKEPNHTEMRTASYQVEENVSAPTSAKDVKLGEPPALHVPSDCGNLTLDETPAHGSTRVCTREERDLTGEGDVDDWMKVGKFPNLESRIEEVRSRVLKKSAGVLNKLLTKFPSSGPNDPEASCITMERLDVECTVSEKEEREQSVDECDVADQSESKEANPSIQKQVHAYVKEHLRPLYKSGVITSKEYQWATAKTASKVMQYHPGAKSAAFLISEGSKVKKLAEDYLQAFTQRKS